MSHVCRSCCILQTKDEVTSAAVMRLREHGLTVDNVIATPEQRIAEIIKPVGFWRKKAVYLKNTARLSAHITISIQCVHGAIVIYALLSSISAVYIRMTNAHQLNGLLILIVFILPQHLDRCMQ